MVAQRISIDLDASDAAVTRLERHSYVNLINVIHAELQLVERMIDAPGSLRSTIHLAEAASRAFKESRVARRHIDELSRFADLVEFDLEETLVEAGEKANQDDVREACAILLEVLPDAHLRVQEVIARHRLARPTVECRADDLSRRLVPVGSEARLSIAGDPVAVPAGLERGLRAIVAAESRLARITAIDIRCGSATEITLRGTGSPDYFEPVVGHLRPSELHAALAERGQPLRGIATLAYLTVPDGSATVDFDSTGSDEAQFTVALRIAGPVAPQNSD